MQIVCESPLQEAHLQAWQALLQENGLIPEQLPEVAVLVFDGDILVATGSRQENLLKYIAVSPARQGEDLTATVLTALRQNAFACGYDHLFLYTKPKNEYLFSSLFFYPIAKTRDVLLMENRPNGIGAFLDTLPVGVCKDAGAVVMNCNPFTKGHRYLIETAATQCDHLYVFVLSEDKSEFSAADRLMLVKEGTKDLPNVTVLPTGPYLISSVTFPTYFLKERENIPQVQCLLDIAIFTRYYAPRFGITRRFVGTEPFCPVTAAYNRTLAQMLPEAGIALCELPRLEQDGVAVSASEVRRLWKAGDWETLRTLVSETTFAYLKRR